MVAEDESPEPELPDVPQEDLPGRKREGVMSRM
jgi:hypothetical protein